MLFEHRRYFLISQEDSHCYRSLKAERYIAYSSFTMVVFSETYTPSKNFRMSFFLTWHDMLMSAADLLTSSMSLPEITSSSLTFVDRTILTPETCQHRFQLGHFIPLAQQTPQDHLTARHLPNRDTSVPLIGNANAKRKHCEHTNCCVHHLRYCDAGVQVFQCKMANQSLQLNTHQDFDTAQAALYSRQCVLNFMLRICV